jgi:hypothetical protein
MRTILAVTSICFIFSRIGLASDIGDAKKFAEEQVQEIEAKKARVKSEWNIETGLRIGVASYEESEQAIQSDCEVIYPEITLTAVNRNENDVEKTISFSFGQTTTDTETWYVNGQNYQTNDLNFYRLNIGASIGRILYSARYKNLQVIPFLGYGFRYINFERSDFNILNIITLREVVTEKYYIHHLDFGLRFNNALSDRWNICGLGAIGYAFYNEADNSALGNIKGGGGYLVDGNISLNYSLTDSWSLIFGGFFELQNLRGSQKGNVIWPDNDLNIYGGNIGMRFIF